MVFIVFLIRLFKIVIKVVVICLLLVLGNKLLLLIDNVIFKLCVWLIFFSRKLVMIGDFILCRRELIFV